MQSRVITEGVPLLENAVPERVQDPGGTYYTVDREGSVRRTPDTPVGVTAAIMVPVKDEGRVVGVVQVMSDTTTYAPEQVEILEGLAVQMAAAVRIARLQDERRRLEAAEAAARAVAAEREQAAHVLEAVGDGIFLCAEDGVVQLWNRAAEVVTGIRATDVVGRRLDEVIPGWPALAEAIPVGGGTSSRAVTLPVERGGRDLWLSFVAVRGAGGIVFAFRDVTNERRLEEEKSDFVATVSHELRTPTAAIYGAAETLLRRGRDLAPGDAQKLLEMVAAQAGRLGHIVDDILLTTKLDRGELAVEREPVDLAELTAETVEAMRPQLPESASVARRARIRPGRRVRRPRPNPAGAREPGRQRRQVRRRRGGDGPRRGGRAGGEALGLRHGAGHPARRAAADLREVLPRRPAADAQPRGHRSRAVHLA